MSSGFLDYPKELTSLSCIAGLSSDELTLFNGSNNDVLMAFFQNNLTRMNGGEYWTNTYQRLYVVNSAIEGLSDAVELTPAVKRQLMGEAKFMRAFYYFYLVNLYGNVPLVLTTNYKVNALIAKTPKKLVYEQVIADLKEAQSLLNDQYIKGDGLTPYTAGSEERVRPTKWAASAMLARTYMYLNDWANAEIQAGLVLGNSTLFNLESLDKVFLKNNKEAIWQLQPVISGYNVNDAFLFLLTPAGPSGSNPVYLRKSLVDSFEPDDQRRNQWINSVTVHDETYYYAYKYKIAPSNDYNVSISEYSTVIRLAELFLIRSEARAHLGNLEGAIADLDEIRKRAGLSTIRKNNPTINQADLIGSVLKERRLEFFTEWGHRWLDLKRTNMIDGIMSKITPEKAQGAPWRSYQQLYSISNLDILRNPNLVQNQGY